VRTALASDEVDAFLAASGWRERERITGKSLGMPPGRAEWLFVVAEPT